MTAVLSATSRDLRVIQVDAFTRPAWVGHLFASSARTATLASGPGGLRIQVTEEGGLCYVQAVLPGAVELDSRDFQGQVTAVYTAIREQLEPRRACYPLRFWNFMPAIHRPAHDGMVSYEVFNAGRFTAFTDWYRTPDFGPRMIAASGIGHRHPDFVVQVLAAERPGYGLENPRQCAAYRYSKRYGPLPPCFARATVAPGVAGGDGGELMIVAGTASVVGEDSLHYGDLEKQVAETCLNLTSLIEAADSRRGIGNGHRPLSLFRELRVYVVDERDREPLVELIASRFPRLEHLEVMPADLCRTDLMVEVEGVVSLP